MSTPYNVGITGLGWMGEAHAQAFEPLSTVEVVAAADFDAASLAAFTEQFGIDGAYETHAEMIASEDLDIVSVCTWPGTHAQLTIDACEAGVDAVLCEKPMATNVGEARDMVDAANRNETELVVAHQRRFSEIHEQVRDVVGNGAVGDPHLIRTGAGQGLLNWGTHLLDLGRFFMGDPDPVWAAGHVERETDRYERGGPIEDGCIGVVVFENGARLMIEMEVPGPDATENILQLYGSEGILDLDLGRSATVTNVDGITEYDPEGGSGGHAGVIRELLEVLEGDRESHRCSGEIALQTMEVIMAIYESVRINRVAQIPLQTRENPLELMIEDELAPTYPGRYDIRRPYESIRDP